MTALTTTAAKQSYQKLTLDDCLGEGWERVLAEASRCVRTHNHGEWAKVAQVVREPRPGLLAVLRGNVVDWLNG